MSGFVKFKLELLEEISLRAFTLVMMKILLLLLRLSDGCNKGKIKLFGVLLFKKDLEACGISEQSAINTIKALVQADVIFEFCTTLSIKGKLTKVFAYSINFNYATWGIPYIFPAENPKEKLNKLISLNLGLKPFQVAKINNLKRCQNYLLYLENHTLQNYFVQIANSIDLGEDVIDKYFFQSNANGKKCILVGFKNALYCESLERLATKCPRKLVVLTLFIVDLQMIYKIVALENRDLEPALIEIIKSPVEALNKVCMCWLNNLATSESKESLRNELELGLSEIFAEYLDFEFDDESEFSREGYVSEKYVSSVEDEFYFNES